jgi:SSS family solute:Na+ symporter
MLKYLNTILFFFCFVVFSQTHTLEQSVLTPVPDSVGLAGMVGGVVDGLIIAGGGANFPEKKPWEGGKKIYNNNLYFLKNNKWVLSSSSFDFPLAYGGSISTKKGVFVFGGENENKTLSEVYKITYSEKKSDLLIEKISELPEPLSYMSVVVENDIVYLVGGKNNLSSVNSFYSFDLSDYSWSSLPSLPGLSRALHSAVIQQSPGGKGLFVFGGRSVSNGKKSEPLTSVFMFDLKTFEWKEKQHLVVDKKERVVMGGLSQKRGVMSFLVYGGSDEVLFNELEEIDLLSKQQEGSFNLDSLKRKKNQIIKNHPGFSNKVLKYNTVTDAWSVEKTLTSPLPVTSLGIEKNSSFIIVSGEVSPGIRTPSVVSFSSLNKDRVFGSLNYFVLIFYLAISVVVGLYFGKKQESTKDYFVGGGRIPWWASGLSVFATLLSAITFMAIPAKTFVDDWSFFMLNITAILIAPFIASVFIPFYNKLSVVTAYEFLEKRFSYFVRAFGSASFILFQLGRVGIILLLPSLAVSVVAGIPVYISILVMGVLCIIYTSVGGVEAVVWTDVMQAVVLLGGGLLAIFWIFSSLDFSVLEIYEYAKEKNKLNAFDFGVNFSTSSFWVVLIGGLFSAMVTQGTDQTVVQRYLTSVNLKNSQKTLYTNALLTLPATLLFFSLGTLLFVFYSSFPEKLSSDISNNDSIFPYYIVNELPAGLSGLLIAGIFAAAMSSVSSSLNSISTSFCNDFFLPYNTGAKDQRVLKIAKVSTVIAGVLGLLLALWMSASNIKSLWDQFYKFLGFFTGGLGGVFLLGIFVKKATNFGAIAGLLISSLLVWCVSNYTDLSFLLYTFVGVLGCFVVGWVFSLKR